jgi:band 4.1-like protein 1/2/3
VKYDPSSLQQVVSGTSTTSAYPFVPTETRTVGGDLHTAPASSAADGSAEESTPTMPVKAGPVVTTLMEQGEVISTQSITSKTRTVETVTVSLFQIFTIFPQEK